MLRSRISRILCGFFLFGALLFLSGSFWLRLLGAALVHADAPQHADVAVVLAGDFYGHRILKAGDMVRDGWVSAVLVSGPPGMYGHHECDPAIEFAVAKGYPRAWFIPAPHEAVSTDGEARALVPRLRASRVHRLLVVTSNYHTARARRVFRSLAPDLDIRMIAAPDEFFQADSWWHSRQGRKQFFFEWSKTLAWAVGL